MKKATKTRKTTKQNQTGGNEEFINKKNNEKEIKAQLLKKIKDNKAPGYGKMEVKKKPYPRSTPDKSKKNNLDSPKRVRPKKKGK